MSELDQQVAEPQEGVTPEGSQPESTETQKYVVDDTEYSVDDIKTWKEDSENKSNWSASNTQKAQELSQQEKNIAEYKELATMLRTNPDLYQRVSDVVQGYYGKEEPETNILNEVKQYRDEIAKTKESIAITQEMNVLKEKYKDFFSQDKELGNKIIKHALEKNVLNMESAFRDYMFDKARELGANNANQRGEEAKKRSQQLGIPTGSAHKGGGLPDIKGKSLSEVATMMANDPRW